MRILIKQIREGPFEDEPYDSVLVGVSEGGNEINIQTREEVSIFKPYLNQWINCLLIINHLVIRALDAFVKKGYPVFTGKCLGDYSIEPEWKFKFDWTNTHLIGVETKEGIVLISHRDCQTESIKEGDTFKFTTWSYDIVAWSPPE